MNINYYTRILSSTSFHFAREKNQLRSSKYFVIIYKLRKFTIVNYLIRESDTYSVHSAMILIAYVKKHQRNIGDILNDRKRTSSYPWFSSCNAIELTWEMKTSNRILRGNYVVVDQATSKYVRILLASGGQGCVIHSLRKSGSEVTWWDRSDITNEMYHAWRLTQGSLWMIRVHILRLTTAQQTTQNATEQLRSQLLNANILRDWHSPPPEIATSAAA